MKNLQSNQKAKRILAGTLASITLIGGSVIYSITNHKKPVDTQPTTTIEQVKEEKLVLSEDFDINNVKDVQEKATAIYEISEKKVSVEDIMNLIYIANNKYDAIKFTSSKDADKFKYIQSLITTTMPELLNDNIADDVNALENKETKPAKDEEIHGYMLLASGEEKKEAIELSKIVIEQLNNIKDGKTDSYKSTAKKYYDKVVSLENKELSDNVLLVMYKDINTKNPLFTMYIAKEEAKYLDSNRQNTPANKVGFDMVSELKIDTQEIIEQGNYGKTITPNGSAYNSKDAARAEAYAENSKTDSTTKIVDEGGKKVSTGSTSIKGSTTSSSTSESVVNDTTKNYTVVEEGGKPVGTEVVTEQLTVPKEENTTIVEYEEEVVELNSKAYSVPSTTYSDSESTTLAKTLK